MKTNKEFSDYVFEKAEKYKAKKAAMYRRISSGIACCLALVVVDEERALVQAKLALCKQLRLVREAVGGLFDI